MKQLLLLTVLGLCLAAGIARADDAATEQLVQQLQGITALQGQFQQRQYSADSDVVLAKTSGNFKLLHPGYFSWELLSPDRQLIIADLSYLWHYDIDLETVTRRPAQGAQQISPLQILGGDAKLLRDDFDVSLDEQHSYVLVPRKDNAGFTSLHLSLQGGVVTNMKILDNLNQRIEIEFRNVDTDSPLSPVDFEFVPPEGVDLFSYDQ